MFQSFRFGEKIRARFYKNVNGIEDGKRIMYSVDLYYILTMPIYYFINVIIIYICRVSNIEINLVRNLLAEPDAIGE